MGIVNAFMFAIAFIIIVGPIIKIGQASHKALAFTKKRPRIRFLASIIFPFILSSLYIYSLATDGSLLVFLEYFIYISIVWMVAFVICFAVNFIVLPWDENPYGKPSLVTAADSKRSTGKKKNDGPIGGSRAVEQMLFDGDPERMRNARRTKKIFGHYPWYIQ